jgi:hypothetical protein
MWRLNRWANAGVPILKFENKIRSPEVVGDVEATRVGNALFADDVQTNTRNFEIQDLAFVAS